MFGEMTDAQVEAVNAVAVELANDFRDCIGEGHQSGHAMMAIGLLMAWVAEDIGASLDTVIKYSCDFARAEKASGAKN